MFPKKQKKMPQGNWKASLAFSSISTIKLSSKELKRKEDPKK
jgi:hypothetical protein